jgi:hypothetical protein
VPVNVWRDIEFPSGLNRAKSTLPAEGHAGRMGKVWAVAEGLPPGAMAFGTDSDLLHLATHRESADTSLAVGFSARPSELDVTDRLAVEAAVRQHFPDARVLATTAHDWVGDPYSKGTWLTYRPGQASRHMSGLQEPEDRISFAGADIALQGIGWMDGALESGAHATRQAVAVLDDAVAPA